nr:DNA-processing protein DprA [uncultured Butyricicoccus sp.]
MSKRVYWLWLATRSDLSAQNIRDLTERFGTPEFLYGANRDVLIHAGLNKRQTDALCDKDLSGAQQILRTCEQKKIQILTIEDSGYPDRLREISDPPPVLYVRGTLPDFDRAPGITIVGTRAASAYGLRMAERFGAALAQAGFTILSGMAHGTDSAAHRGCLKVNGTTVAVLANGVDVCYPKENQYLMGDIMLSGAVVSENPPGTPPEGFRFPIRNRILSGMSVATLLVEAPARSGALITARRAFDQGREVFAVPGPLDTPGAVGGNQLIRDEVARIVTSPMDIVHELAPMLRQKPQEKLVRTVWVRGWDSAGQVPISEHPPRKPAIPKPKLDVSKPQPKPVSKPAAQVCKTDRLPDYLDGTERLVAQAIADGAQTVDAVSEATGLPASEIAAALVVLELEGVAEQKAGCCRLLC